MDGIEHVAKTYDKTKPTGETTIKVMETIKGYKWWLITEIAEYLKIKRSNVESIMRRHDKKFNAELKYTSQNGVPVKLYRIPICQN